jgi:glycosyltransferase involved in cell wall biosynthesis
MDISIFIPVFNEKGSLPELEAWVRKVAENHNLSHEIIFVDDGSLGTSLKVTEGLREKPDAVKGFKFRRDNGNSAVLQTGFLHAEGEVVIAMDSDLQDSPDEIPELHKIITVDGFDLVSGWRKNRYNPIWKRWLSKFINFTTSFISGIKIHDFTCVLKAHHKSVVKSIEIFGEMYRYIPLIAMGADFVVEMISGNAHEINDYLMEKKIGTKSEF